MIRFVFLLTDFGLNDPYVAQMKMVIYSELKCNVIDISHGVSPFNTLNGAFFLKANWKYLPHHSICLVVVDPGVGSDRDIILCEASGERYVIAPDNGVVSWILDDIVKLWVIDKGFFKEVSSTFHGRDIFAPIAVRLINKTITPILKQVSKDSIKKIEPPDPLVNGNRLIAKVLHIDRFGNCVLSIPSSWKKTLFSKSLKLEKPKEVDIVPSTTYSFIPKGSVGIVDGSQGFLELGLNMASCSNYLGLQIGSECIILVKHKEV